MTTANNSIILYPREYNLRGGDAKGSVKGVTHDGELVNIKLRVSGNVKNQEAQPSISTLAKTSMAESKHSCLSSPDNGPENPMGVLLFQHCQVEKARDPDPEYSEYYVSSWAQVLRNGHKAIVEGDYGNGLFIGTARMVIDKQSLIIKRAKESIRSLTQSKPSEWEEAVRRNEALISDFKSYDYFLYGYLNDKERFFDLDDEAEMLNWMDSAMGDPVHNSIHGIFIRVEKNDGVIISELVQEMFPIFLKDLCRYQNAKELIHYFKSMNPDIAGIEGARYRVMPMVKFAGRKIYRDSLVSQQVFQTVEETYYVGGIPQVFSIAAKVDLMDNGAIFLGKVHLLGPSMGPPVLLGAAMAPQAYVSEAEPESIAQSDLSAPLLISEQITENRSIFLADWYRPIAPDLQALTTIEDDAPEALLISPSIPSTPLPDALIERQEEAAIAEELAPVKPTQPERLDTTIAVEPPFLSDQPGDEKTNSAQELSNAGGQEGLLLDDEALFADEEIGSLDTDEADEGPSLFGSKPLSFDHLRNVRTSHAPPIEPKAPEVGDRIKAELLVEIIDETLLDDVAAHNDQENTPSVAIPAVDADFFADEVDASDASLTTEDDFDPWMDEDDLAKKLDEAPDAYSEETESDSLAAIPEEKVIIPSQIEPVTPPPLPAATPPESSPTPRKGGLASFLKNRKSQA